jgi:hypothetical protein
VWKGFRGRGARERRKEFYSVQVGWGLVIQRVRPIYVVGDITRKKKMEAEDERIACMHQ